MRTWRQYKNYSRKAKITAWCIDLTAGTLFKIAAACGRAIRNVFPASPQGPPAPMKLLLIRLDHIGDLLMTTPAIHVLKKRFPESSLTLLASPSSLPVVAGNPDIDHVCDFRVSWYDGGRTQWFSLPAVWRLIRRLRREHFDAAIDFRGDFRVMFLFLLLSRARQRIGFSGLGGDFLLTHSFPYDPIRHFVEINLDLVKILTGQPTPAGSRCILFPSAEDAAAVDLTLAQSGLSASDRIIAIHPTAVPHWQLKRWAPERFAALADALIQQEKATIVFTGGEEDLPEINHIVSIMKEPAVNLAGKSSVLQLAELIGRCRLFVSNDTGPMHIAAAVGTPLVAIFGPTDPQRSGPNGNPRRIRVIRRNVSCRRPCFVAECAMGHECMNGIEVADVFRACEELLRLQDGPGENSR